MSEKHQLELSPPQLEGQEPGQAVFVNSRYACISMNMFDRLRLIEFPNDMISIIRGAVLQSWRKGIQDERLYHGAHEFKLKGNPWLGQSSDAVPARTLMCTVLATLYDQGWTIIASTDISKKQMDKDALLFRHQYPPPTPCVWMAISFNMGDRIRLVNAPEELIAPFRLMLGPLLQKESWKDRQAYEFKLRGWPWFAEGAEAVSTRIVLLNMLRLLEFHGFSLYASIDQNTGPGGDSRQSETDTWFCRRPVNWEPGTPAY